jgi:hypothetical protein
VQFRRYGANPTALFPTSARFSRLFLTHFNRSDLQRKAPSTGQVLVQEQSLVGAVALCKSLANGGGRITATGNATS